MREREAFKKFDKVFREGKAWLETKANNIEEMEKNVSDEMLEAVTNKEKEKEKKGKRNGKRERGGKNGSGSK